MTREPSVGPVCGPKRPAPVKNPCGTLCLQAPVKAPAGVCTEFGLAGLNPGPHGGHLFRLAGCVWGGRPSTATFADPPYYFSCGWSRPSSGRRGQSRGTYGRT